DTENHPGNHHRDPAPALALELAEEVLGAVERLARKGVIHGAAPFVRWRRTGMGCAPRFGAHSAPGGARRRCDAERARPPRAVAKGLGAATTDEAETRHREVRFGSRPFPPASARN